MHQYLAKLTSKSQIVIPQEVRDLLNFKQGDYVVFEVDDNKKITVKKGRIIIETED